jgi:hypothetical protein
LIGEGYKGELSHSKISVKFRIFDTHIDLFEEKTFLTLFSGFLTFPTCECAAPQDRPAA